MGPFSEGLNLFHPNYYPTYSTTHQFAYSQKELCIAR